MKYFQEVDPKKSVDEREREIERFWRQDDTFRKSLFLRKDAPRYTFYDGPPFATGTPHYGHLEQSLLKDVVPRYWTMRGKYVERRWGWDCHGLPIENIVEKEMGSQSKKDIEAIGIEKFNERCRANVLSYVDDWKKIISRFGRWADMDNPYNTMDPEYMESVWWVFGQLWKKGLIYEGYRSMHVCPRCETTLSQSEVAEGYKDIKDLSVVAKFELVDEPGTFVLAWTTTPWTLLGNVALAVNSGEEYGIFEITSQSGMNFLEKGDRIIFQKSTETIFRLFKNVAIYEGGFIAVDFGAAQFSLREIVKGKDLIGKAYTPLFDFSQKDKKIENRENGWKIYGADFVTTEEGTGVVHIAPAYGTDDMNLGKKEQLPFVQHVGLDGIIKEGYGDFSGMDVKPRAKDKPEEVREIDITLLKALKEGNIYFSHEKYLHSYPHCWRCDTALLNYATTSWFVAVEKMKEKALETAQDIHWVPGHVKEGRFGKWLEGARDWSISRQRFWASVMPVWKCEVCPEVRVVSNVMDIAHELGGVNRLYLIRHGEAKSNVEQFLDSHGDAENHLTEKGKQQVKESAKELSTKKIDYIITSPLVRTRETAEILAKELGIDIEEDGRLRETGFGVFEGKSVRSFREKHPLLTKQSSNQDKVETYEEILDRVREFLDEINVKYQGKNILIVGHMDSLMVLDALTKKKEKNDEREMWHARNAEIRSTFSRGVDLHRPYIDNVVLTCACGGTMKRVPDVLDTWFDSGSMPYAQLHYPFENEANFKQSFPADFIGEMVEQSRTWFYYLHVLGTAVQESIAFRNVVADGVILAEDGKKMSKKLKNYPDPLFVMEKYGSDVLRMYLLNSTLYMAENLNFSEKELSELSRGMFRMLRNTYSFFVMYANVDGWRPGKSEKQSKENVLDRWILSELQLLIQNVNEAMKIYELARAVRHFAPFIDDLSNWYIRRSRRRFWKSENDGDKDEAYETLYLVLVELSKLLAPFAPFVAEEMYQNLTQEESVHLTDYPQMDAGLINEELMEDMHEARSIVSVGLQFRAQHKIKVRQPLASVQAKKIPKELQEMVKDELNVKEYIYNKGGKDAPTVLDLAVTPELKMEGQAREIVRTVQSLRKKTGYNVDDRIVLHYEGMQGVFECFGKSIIAKETLSTIGLGKIDNADAWEDVDIDGESVVLWIKK